MLAPTFTVGMNQKEIVSSWAQSKWQWTLWCISYMIKPVNAVSLNSKYMRNKMFKSLKKTTELSRFLLKKKKITEVQINNFNILTECLIRSSVTWRAFKLVRIQLYLYLRDKILQNKAASLFVSSHMALAVMIQRVQHNSSP